METTPEARILVVDDNPDIINLTSRILRPLNYQVFTAANGQEALDVVEAERPDLILLDVMMPIIDGLEVCRAVKGDRETRNIMVIMITGCGSLDDRVRGLEAGADDYITKPFQVTELKARVRSALRIKKLSDEVAERNRLLLEAQKERLRSEKLATIGLLTTGIAHEFNNIMSGIAGFAQLAKKNVEYRDQLVDVAVTQAERAMSIANSLSTYYRPTGEKRPTDIRQVVDSAICLVVKELKERGIELHQDFQEVPPVLVQPGQLQEVILNLTINAVHAIERDGKITLKLDQQGSNVRFSVSDTGCGVQEEIIDRIFDPFFTTKGALGGGTASGSGLGLSVSYNIVKSHGGDLTVTSEPGRGSTFTMTLPAEERAPVAEPPEGSPAAVASTPAMRTVLISDADESVQELVGNYLQEIQTLRCTSWEQMISRLDTETVGTVLIDAELPSKRPFEERFDTLLADHPNLTVILTSSHLSNEHFQRCLPRAHGHLLKPYTIENLADLLALKI